MSDSFNKVFIGSGLIAEMFLNALINHKGESPADFYVIGKRSERCQKVMEKYGIKVDYPEDFVANAKVVVLAVDLDCLRDIDELAKSIRDIIPPDALINSVTPHLKIKDIEYYFPNHAVMRLALHLSMISGFGIGTYCCGSKALDDTQSVAKFLVESFGDALEVSSEEELEKVWNVIHAESCLCCLILKCLYDSGSKAGISGQQAQRIALSVFKGTAETFLQKRDDDLLTRAFEYDNFFASGLKLLQRYGIADDLQKIIESQPNELGENFGRTLDAMRKNIHINT